MTIPSITVGTTDGMSGLSGLSTPDCSVHVGVCSAGTVETVYFFTDLDTLRSSMGYGPAVEACALDIAVNGIGGICRVTGSAASTPTLAQSGTGPVITVTGTPLDEYDLILKIIEGGARATATFHVSLDGGDTWSNLVTTATTVTDFAASTGLTFAFAVGTYVASETYSATCAAPTYTSGNLVLAVQAVCNSTYDFRYIHVVGTASSVANYAALCVAVSTALETFETSGARYKIAIMSAPSDTDANLIAGMLTTTARRVVNVADFVDVTSPLDLTSKKRLASYAFAPWVSSHPIHHHPGRRADGPLFGFVTKSYRDERKTPGLYDARFSTVQTDVEDRTGLYFTGGKTLAATGSDYAEIQLRTVMDRACELTRIFLRRLHNDHSFETDKITKCLTERQASSLDDDCRTELSAGLVSNGHAASVDVRFSRSEQTKITKKLRVKITIEELTYGNFLTAEIGFFGTGHLFAST